MEIYTHHIYRLVGKVEHKISSFRMHAQTISIDTNFVTEQNEEEEKNRTKSKHFMGKKHCTLTLSALSLSRFCFEFICLNLQSS